MHTWRRTDTVTGIITVPAFVFFSCAAPDTLTGEDPRDATPLMSADDEVLHIAINGM